MKRKYTVENGPLVKIRETFQKRLNLGENEYLSDLPDEIRDEIEKEVIDLVVEGRSAFTIGDPTTTSRSKSAVVTGSSTSWCSRSPSRIPSSMRSLVCCPKTTPPH